jgi:hypothetical protein
VHIDVKKIATREIKKLFREQHLLITFFVSEDRCLEKDRGLYPAR